MAIFGVGSNWEGDELKQNFFEKELFTVGWSISEGEDLYNAVSSLKVGDIIYIKANSPGSRNLRVKGIGIVTDSLFQTLIIQNKEVNKIKDYSGLSINVKWLVQKEFQIKIPVNAGRLTNVRAATYYEEFLPFVQKEIIKNLCHK